MVVADRRRPLQGEPRSIRAPFGSLGVSVVPSGCESLALGSHFHQLRTWCSLADHPVPCTNPIPAKPPVSRRPPASAALIPGGWFRCSFRSWRIIGKLSFTCHRQISTKGKPSSLASVFSASWIQWFARGLEKRRTGCSKMGLEFGYFSYQTSLLFNEIFL